MHHNTIPVGPQGLPATHRISFWGVPCYFNEPTGFLWGANCFAKYFIAAAVLFHNTMSLIAMMVIPGWRDPGFLFKVRETYPLQPTETLRRGTNEE